MGEMQAKESNVLAPSLKAFKTNRVARGGQSKGQAMPDRSLIRNGTEDKFT